MDTSSTQNEEGTTNSSILTKEQAIKQAKDIPKGLTVENEATLRPRILNKICGLLMTGQLKRGKAVLGWSKILGIEEDRPKQLIQFIKGGGGTPEQIENLYYAVIYEDIA
jgi:hypothetical protein